VDRRRHRDDVEGAVGEPRRIGGELELVRGDQLLGRDLHRLVVTLLELIDAALANVEPDSRQLAAEGQRHRKSDIAETDNGNLLLLESRHRREAEHEARGASKRARASQSAPLTSRLTDAKEC